ncbi:MAG: hypothetical protein H0W37_02360 [Pseudonocardiales bacterium]|nr:hypothetical protein [Pseudonocardiales bacterium]
MHPQHPDVPTGAHPAPRSLHVPRSEQLGHVAEALNLSLRDVLDRLDGQQPGQERT